MHYHHKDQEDSHFSTDVSVDLEKAAYVGLVLTVISSRHLGHNHLLPHGQFDVQIAAEVTNKLGLSSQFV